MKEYNRKHLQAMPSITFLMQRNVEYELNDDETKINKIKLPCTGDEMLDMMDMEGKTLGVCCATISEMRDILIEAAREGCWVDPKDLKSFHDMGMEHGHFDPKKGDWKHPVHRLMFLWDTVKDDVELDEDYRDRISTCDFKDPADMLLMIGQLSSWIDLNSMMGNPKDRTDFRYAAIMNDFYLLGACMKAYGEEMHKIAEKFNYPDEIEVFAVVREDGHIARGRIGALVFLTNEIAEKVVKGDKTLSIKKAILSLKTGIRVLTEADQKV